MSVVSGLKKLVAGLKKKSKPAYQTGWQNGASAISTPIVEANYFVWRDAGTGWASGSANSTVPSSGGIEVTAPSIVPSDKSGDAREVKKPVELVGNILVEEPKMNMADLKTQIAVVQHRMKIIKDLNKTINTSDEELALYFLRNRLKYEKTKHLFKWQITTEQMIVDLCSKYKVQKVSFASYYKNVPMEAVTEIEKFSASWDAVFGKKAAEPTLELIVDYGGKETKKDPILLAPSPFGRWYYILGAWDKEVEIVDDLVYNGK